MLVLIDERWDISFSVNNAEMKNFIKMSLKS